MSFQRYAFSNQRVQQTFSINLSCQGGDIQIADIADLDLVEDDADLQDRQQAHELEQSWEPPHPQHLLPIDPPQANLGRNEANAAVGQPHVAHQRAHVDEEDEEQNKAGRDVQQDVRHWQCEDARADSHPRILSYSRHHRNSKAGQPLKNAQPGDQTYAQGLGTSADNPWAPFSSKLDWDVAQWAKM